MRPAPILPPLGRGVRVLVVGLGRHGGGVAAVRYLAAHGCDVRVTDILPTTALAPALRALKGVRFERRFGGHRMGDVRWADVVVQNPAVPREHPLVRAARRLRRPIVNDVVLFLAAAPGPVVAVTGTRGKSTTVALTAAMLGAPRGGLPGEPMLPLLRTLRPGDPAVIEASSWQCELVRRNRTAPDVAVLTNLSRDHLNRYPSLGAYAEAKAGLLQYQTVRDSSAVLNRDDARVRAFGRRVRGHRAWFSRQRFPSVDGTFLERGWFVVRDGGAVHRVALRRDLKLPGDHLAANALAAIAAAWWLGARGPAVQRALRRFRGLPGRQELVRTVRGVRYINDTTATSPAGTLAALTAYRSLHPILIAGGADKGLAFAALGRAIDRSVLAVVLLPGDASERLVRFLHRVPVYRIDGMPAAVRTAARLAPRGSAVLLSPGAASFNLFAHEFDRGDQFVTAVRSIA